MAKLFKNKNVKLKNETEMGLLAVGILYKEGRPESCKIVFGVEGDAERTGTASLEISMDETKKILLALSEYADKSVCPTEPDKANEG